LRRQPRNRCRVRPATVARHRLEGLNQQRQPIGVIGAGALLLLKMIGHAIIPFELPRQFGPPVSVPAIIKKLNEPFQSVILPWAQVHMEQSRNNPLIC
jgi:hypothetical protein